jgi:uncharacterized protein (DUF488 family)
VNQEALQIFTIGHSNHQLEIFLDLLDRHGIEVLVDIRSIPYSKFAPQYDKANLKENITGAGLKFLFMGKELGGRPDGQEFYDAAGRANYAKIAQSDLFKEGISRLETGMKQYRVVIMCSEENPEHCHRHLLIARVLLEKGIAVKHIRLDGRLQDDAELEQSKDGQMSLFDLGEVTAWKSIQSVLPKKPPNNSSKP